MLDALLAIDPMSIPLFGVIAFAAGLYPLGIMLGAPCSACCKCSACPDETELPETLTVTLSGFKSVARGQNDLVFLSFSACYGGGASGRVLEPGGDPNVDAGPISSVLLTNGGSGYAKFGRVEPTVAASPNGGAGGLLAVTLSQTQDECGVDYWEVDSIAIDDQGAGYTDGSMVTFSVDNGDTAQAHASATIGTLLEEPTLSVTANGGNDADLALSVTQSGSDPDRWAISSVSVNDGGAGYTDLQTATVFLGEGDVEESAALLYIRTGREEPTLTVEVESGGGAGSQLTPTLTQSTFGGSDVWGITSVAIDDGGSGYAVGDSVSATLVEGVQVPGFMGPTYFYGTVSSVDGNGAITGIAITFNGKYYKDSGVIESVLVTLGGSYYKDSGEIASVTVTNGGVYYREDANSPPYVATVDVSISVQHSPSDGDGASITATVGNDPGNPATFGKVTGLTIADGGDGYLAWEWKRLCCDAVWNNKSITLRRDGCKFAHTMCAPVTLDGVPGNYVVLDTSVKRVTVTYPGPSSPPTLEINGVGATNAGSSAQCNVAMTGSRNITDCSDWSSLTFSPVVGDESAVASTGDDYDSSYLYPGDLCDCNLCCQGSESMPLEVEVQITDNRGPFMDNFAWPPVTQNYQTFLATPITDMSGTYVLSRWNCTEWRGMGPCQIFLDGIVRDDHFRIRAKTSLCAAKNQSTDDYYEPDQYGCDGCHSECRAIIAIDVPTDVNADSLPGDGFLQETPACDECEPTPICGLAPHPISMKALHPFGSTPNMLTITPT